MPSYRDGCGSGIFKSFEVIWFKSSPDIQTFQAWSLTAVTENMASIAPGLWIFFRECPFQRRSLQGKSSLPLQEQNCRLYF